MKTYTLILIALVFASLTTCYAQTQDNSLKLQDIQLSNAPAFSLLDISPSSIETPNSTKAFSTSILNNISQSNGIPQNYAVEFTPFWFQSHPKMTNYKYFGISPTGGSKPFSQARLLSVSFAVINNDTTTNKGKLGNHNAALGIRATLIKIYDKKRRDSILSTAKHWDDALALIIKQQNGDPLTKDQLDVLSNQLKYADTIKNFLAEKPLFSLDAAAATNLNFANNSFNSNHISRSGFWLNANLSLKLNKEQSTANNYLTFSGLARYINAKDSLNSQGAYVNSNLFDFGIKTEFQFGKISLAYEYVNRSSSDKSAGTSFKSVGLVHYKIKDGLFLTGAFGRNFPTVNNLITTIGINWGISNGKENVDSGQ
jgi:hypothetical protein